MGTLDTSAEHYRRRWGTSVWHFSRHCSEWPATMDCEERIGLPRVGSMCPQCAMLLMTDAENDALDAPVREEQASPESDDSGRVRGR
jgi:hypothetical protein